MTDNAVCPICESHNTSHIISLEPVDYKHMTQYLPLHYSECMDCGEEFATNNQTSLNLRYMEHFKEEVESTIDYYDKALSELYDRGSDVKSELELFCDYLERNGNRELSWEIIDGKLIEDYVRDCFGHE